MHLSEWRLNMVRISNADEDVEKLDRSYSTGVKAKWYITLENSFS